MKAEFLNRGVRSINLCNDWTGFSHKRGTKMEDSLLLTHQPSGIIYKVKDYILTEVYKVYNPNPHIA